MKPAWQTDELEDEWIDQDEEEQPSASVIHNASDVSLTQPVDVALNPSGDSDEDTSHSDAPSIAGTFLIRQDMPVAPILPKTPGYGKKGLVKDFFSPLALERMFEPPSPPMNESTPLPLIPSTTPAIPSRLSQVHFPNQDSSISGETPVVDTDGDEERDSESEHPLPSLKEINAAPTCRFTFSAPRPNPSNLPGLVPTTHSTPGPFRTPQQPPSTDPRLRLFHFQYDTFTRDHLSAMVDSIAVNTPSGASVSEPSARAQTTPGISERSFSRLRSAKRIKLSPPSELSSSGDGEAFIIRPDDEHRDYVGEARSLMEKIRQTRDFSTITTTTTAQSPMNQKIGRPLHGPNLSRNLQLPSPPPSGQNQIQQSTNTSAQIPYSYSSLGYREQAANLMAQIRDDVKSSKRSFSVDTEASQLVRRDIDHNGSGIQSNAPDDNSFAYDHDTEIITENLDKYIAPSGHTTTTMNTRAHEGSSVQQYLPKVDSAAEDVQSLIRSLSQVSLDSESLLHQFPVPPIGLLVTSPPMAIPTPISPINPPPPQDPTHLVPAPAYPSSSLRSGRNEDLNRFVSSSTTSGTTLTVGSTASFVKHPGPKQMTHIAPSDIPALPERVGKMVFDKVQMKWVKANVTEDVHEEGVVDTILDVEADSEDPFRDIESLREEDSGGRGRSPIQQSDDGGEVSMDLDKSGIQEVPIEVEEEREDEEEANLTSFSFDGLSLEVAPATCSHQYDPLDDSESEDEPSDDETETTEQPSDIIRPMDDSYIVEDDVESAHSDLLERVTLDSPTRESAPISKGLNTPSPPTRVQNVPTPITRSAMKSNSVTPVSAMKDPSRNRMQTPSNRLIHRRSVSFSDGKRDGPILGVGRNAPTPDTTNSTEMDNESDVPVVDGTITSARSQPALPSARSKRIADMLEDLEDDAFDDDSPSKASSGRPLSNELQPLRPRKPSSTRAVVGSPSRELSRRVFSRSGSMGPSKGTSGNATFLTECSFGVAHDRLVQVITDIQPFEPHWEELSSIDLSRKSLDSVARLKEFLPKLDLLALNSNQLSWLSGIPGTVRTLSVVSNWQVVRSPFEWQITESVSQWFWYFTELLINSLTSVTSFSHLHNLENLDISHNGIDSLRQLECLRHLRELRADGNRIDSIDGLQNMDGLVKLSLQRNDIRSMDLTNYRWTRLEMLNMSQNKLGSVQGLSSLPVMAVLNLDNNVLGELETERPMPRLIILRVSGNRLAQLNASQFPNLRTLYADNNSISLIVKASRLTRLENLSLRNQGGRNSLNLSMADVRDIKRLYFSGNPLKPGFISEPCYNLIYLEIAACRITTLPQNLSQMLPNLRVLNLNYNFLEDTRPLEGLTRLRKLTIIGSRIKATKQLIRLARSMADIEMLDFRMNPCTLGWYLPILVKDVPGALQPSDGDRLGSHSGSSAPSRTNARGKDGPEGSERKGANKTALESSANPMNSGSRPESSNEDRERESLRNSTGSGGVTWKDLDSKFRRDLPDDAYAGRLVYRGLVMGACPAIRMLDGVEVSEKEKEKAGRVLKGVVGITREKILRGSQEE